MKINKFDKQLLAVSFFIALLVMYDVSKPVNIVTIMPLPVNQLAVDRENTKVFLEMEEHSIKFLNGNH